MYATFSLVFIVSGPKLYIQVCATEPKEPNKAFVNFFIFHVLQTWFVDESLTQCPLFVQLGDDQKEVREEKEMAAAI